MSLQSKYSQVVTHGDHMRSEHRHAQPAEIPEVFKLHTLNNVDMFEISIDELQQHLRDFRFTSVDLIMFSLQRAHRIDPFLESIVEINPYAVQLAEQMDNERRIGKERSILHGIPVLVKDNIATEDDMQTTAGSWALLGSTVPRDAHIVNLLREAGAIIIGHTNMSEWASARSSTGSTGYSPRGGQTRNPYDLSSSPFGSSSGSAVAVSANIVPLSFGTETDSSIIGPASLNGIVGIKPTVGLTSRNGVIPISRNMDTVGSFGRTVADAVHGLNVIVGSDEKDQATCSSSRAFNLDLSKSLTTRESLKGAKFGLPRKRCWDLVSDERKAVAMRIFEAIKLAGGEIRDIDFPCAEDRIPPDGNWDWTYGEPSQSEITVVKTDAYNGINSYLGELDQTSIRSVEDIVEYNEKNRGTEGAHPGDHPAYPTGQDLLREIARSCGKEDQTYQAALVYIQTKTRAEGIDAALKDQSGERDFDALLLCDRKGSGQQLAAQAGYPIICIPIGVDAAGLPFSLSIQHTAWKEELLIKWASAIEDLIHHTSGRVRPSYRNHMSKNIPIAKKATE